MTDHPGEEPLIDDLVDETRLPEQTPEVGSPPDHQPDPLDPELSDH
ncbi:hypothetical protein EV138_6180 [Kribbella voronezhensis]|uniref:Uncharacterized protein n=1 Tax=Kribbella voronezhensis TaxID=2512212 RepID=A0A4R7SYB4_9ACTN|nr:hypothetical protein [Kribbella voronezhensis]TDU83716.1 hypothetical protein EV138_6180 [Kribbella voronezhensis]